MIDIKKLPNSEIEIKVTLSWDEWKKYVKQATADISKEIKVPGFREGKAPKSMIEKKVGANAILEEAGQKAIQASYAEILKTEKIEAIGHPKAEILKIAEGNDFEYKIITAVIPEISLSDWKKEVKKINSEYKDKKVEVKDEDIEKELTQLANSRVKLVTVSREAKEGDSIVIDFQVKRDGVPIEGGTSKKHPLILGKGVFIPGFEENVIGMKEGEEKEFELSFPKEYHDKNLAGRPATFSVKVGLVQERQTPEMNDEFVKSLGNFETVADLKKNLVEGLEKDKEKEMIEKKRAEYIEVIVKSSEVNIPAVLLSEELSRMIGEFEMQLAGMNMDLERYLEQIKKTREEIEKDWEPQARKRIIAALALEKIAKDESIEIDAKKVEEEMNNTLAQYKNIKDVEKNIDLARLYNFVKGNLQNEEVFKTLEALSK